MLVVVCYDVPDDGRRARLHRLLLGFGTPVQRSVFECELTPAQLALLRRRLARLARPDRDAVCLYTLCQACVTKVDRLGAPPPEHPPDYYLV